MLLATSADIRGSVVAAGRANFAFSGRSASRAFSGRILQAAAAVARERSRQPARRERGHAEPRENLGQEKRGSAVVRHAVRGDEKDLSVGPPSE